MRSRLRMPRNTSVWSNSFSANADVSRNTCFALVIVVTKINANRLRLDHHVNVISMKFVYFLLYSQENRRGCVDTSKIENVLIQWPFRRHIYREIVLTLQLRTLEKECDLILPDSIVILYAIQFSHAHFYVSNNRNAIFNLQKSRIYAFRYMSISSNANFSHLDHPIWITFHKSLETNGSNHCGAGLVVNSVKSKT